MKKFFGEFKEFISKRNVIDMAIGVVVGAAFKAIVDSLVNDIIMPVVGWLLNGVDFTRFSYILSKTTAEDGTEIINAIMYGKFVNNIISFIIIAFSMFITVKLINNLRRKKEAEAPAPEPEKEPEPTKEELLLTEIRDVLKSNSNKQ